MTTRKINVLLAEPVSVKSLQFIHPPANVRTKLVSMVNYPFTGSVGITGIVTISLSCTGHSRAALAPHSVINTDNSISSCTAQFPITLASTTGVHTQVWDVADTLALVPVIDNMASLDVQIRYIPIDGTSQPALLNTHPISIVLDITADW